MFDGPTPSVPRGRAPTAPLRVAVVGSGIAGLAAAHLLSGRHRVTLFESAPRPGGHSCTLDVPAQGQDGETVPVDAGFIVYNERSYPNLTALFRVLGVETGLSDMSFAVSTDRPRGGSRNGSRGRLRRRRSFEYAASASLPALFAQRRNMVDPGFLLMLRDVVRFQRDMRARLADDSLGDATLGEVLAAGAYGARLRDDYLVPMAAAVWSGTRQSILDFPASTYLRFCLNHGMLTMSDRPLWRTVTGGSRNYVAKLTADLPDTRYGQHVRSVCRAGGQVTVTTGDGQSVAFDQVVLASHSDQSLAMLADPTPAERSLLGAIRYQPNRVVVHADPALMPRRRKTWSSWNYVDHGAPVGQARGDITEGDADTAPVGVTYWMNRLQNLGPVQNIFVSLNPSREPDHTFAEMSFAHPQFDLAAIRAQQRLHTIQGTGGVWYCGAWCGHGFHEDGLVSGLTVARWLGAPAPWQAHAGGDRVPMAGHTPVGPALDLEAAA